MITHSIEINRSAEDVFAYLDDVERHGEWQDAIVSTKLETPGPVGVGSRVLEIRKAGGREQDASYEITEHDPPHKTAFRGVAGPVRPVGTVTVEPVEGGSKSRVSIDFDLVGYGFGKLIAPLARMQARKEIATSQQQLKTKLEAGV
ncbi:MAG TPA: SRPBCC family protein [Solirubrobacteraceae bacterium]|nr:SRPBCC family protein [Solirubrobacteraceae bacterium]